MILRLFILSLCLLACGASPPTSHLPPESPRPLVASEPITLAGTWEAVDSDWRGVFQHVVTFSPSTFMSPATYYWVVNRSDSTRILGRVPTGYTGYRWLVLRWWRGRWGLHPISPETTTDMEAWVIIITVDSASDTQSFVPGVKTPLRLRIWSSDVMTVGNLTFLRRGANPKMVPY